jgi:hypothetical protein
MPIRAARHPVEIADAVTAGVVVEADAEVVEVVRR